MIDRFRWLLGRREDSLAVQSIILTIARFAGFSFSFAIPLVLVRVFNQAEFGIYKQLFLIAGTAIPILSLGLWASILYFVPRDEKDGQRYVLQALIILSVTGALAGLALVLSADTISRLFHAPSLRDYLPVLAIFVFLSVPSELIVAVPVADRRPTVAGFSIAGSDIIRASAIVLAALLARTIEAVLWAAVSAMALRAVWLLVYVRLRHDPARQRLRPDIRGQLGYALPFAAAVLFETGLARFHEYYVAGSVEPAKFAIYAIGVLHIPIIGMLAQSVAEVMIVRAADAYRAGDRRELRRLWHAAVARLGVFLVPCWALAELLAPDLIGLLFGSAYLDSVPIFRIFLMTVPLMIVVDHGILRATGDTPYILKTNVVGFAVSVAGVLLLTRFSTVLGAVSGFILGIVTLKALGLAKVARRLQLGPGQLLPWRGLGRVMLAVAVSTGLAATALVLPHPLLRIGVGGLLFAAAYVVIVLRWELVPRGEIRALLVRFIPAYRSPNYRMLSPNPRPAHPDDSAPAQHLEKRS